jgi:hypothetical protein
MGIWPRRAPAPEPQTCVGQWLRAGFLNQQELRDQLKLRLNGGEPKGWNFHEPAVVGFVCEIAVRRLFPSTLDGSRHSHRPERKWAWEAAGRTSFPRSNFV